MDIAQKETRSGSKRDKEVIAAQQLVCGWRGWMARHKSGTPTADSDDLWARPVYPEAVGL